MKKSFKWIIGAAVLLIAVLVIFGRKNSNKGTEITTHVVAKGSITEVIPANGKIKPVVEVKISPDVSGEIVELNFKEGDMIKRGELVIKIKQDIYISMKDRAEASLNSVKAQLTQQLAQFRQIEQSYLRNKTLFEQKAISEADYENALSQFNVTKEQIKAAEFNVKSATAALQEAQDNLVKTTIYAPMDGIISKMNVEKGERVVGTSQMAGTEEMTEAGDMWRDFSYNAARMFKKRDGDTISYEILSEKLMMIADKEELIFKNLEKLMKNAG